MVGFVLFYIIDHQISIGNYNFGVGNLAPRQIKIALNSLSVKSMPFIALFSAFW